MVLGRQTNFFLGKTQKTKKNIFWETMGPDSKKMVFLVFPRKKMVLGRKTNFFRGKRWFWAEKNPKPSFSSEKVGFSAQNHLFPRKKLVFLPKTIFFLGKTKKTIFLESGPIVSQKMVSLVFRRKKLVFCAKPSFS